MKKTIKIKFLEDKFVDGKLAFEKGKVYEIPVETGSATRWLKRGGIDVEEEAKKLEEENKKLKDKQDKFKKKEEFKPIKKEEIVKEAVKEIEEVKAEVEL